jgi:hypothetical protein
MSPSAELVERLERGCDALLAMAPRVEAGRPWQLSEAFGVEPESHWGPPEVLAHVAEMLPYWQGEIARVLDGPDEPDALVPFGRVAANGLRIGIIERDRTLPPIELFERIDAGAERFGRFLRELADEDAARRGVHPTLGGMDVLAIADRFVVGHLEEHVAQLREALDGTAQG